MVSFARGLNDTPKIAGFLLVLGALDIELGLVAIGVAMAVGGLVHSRGVGETVSNRITPMNHGQGYTVYGQPCDGSAGDDGERARNACFDDARVGGLDFRDREGYGEGECGNHKQNFGVLGAYVARGFPGGWGDLLAAVRAVRRVSRKPESLVRGRSVLNCGSGATIKSEGVP